MGGGKSPTTNVTNTGLGDSQYASLRSGQDSIRNDIGSVSTGARDEIRRLEQPIDQIDNRVQNLAGDQRMGFADVNRALESQSQSFGSQLAGVNQGLSGVNTAVGNVGRDVTAGFSNMDNQFSQVGQQLTGLDNNVTQGFANAADRMNAGFTDLRTGMDDQFDTASQERMAGFTGLGDMVGTGFAGQADFLNQMSTNILGGQAGLNDLLTATGGRLDTYYGDLAQGQAGIADQVGGVQTGLNDFTNQYDDDVALANRSRADIQQGMMNQTDRIRNDVGAMQNANNEAQQRIMQAVSGVQDDVRTSVDQSRAGFANTLATSADARSDFNQQIGTVRNFLATAGRSLDAGTQSQYTDLVNSFDQTGALIPNSIEQSGLRISRALDNGGNLLLDRSDPAGNPVNRRLLNVPQMLSQAQQYQQTLAAGQVQSGGFASPFTQSR